MQISGGFAFEIGLPPNWRIVEETEYKSLQHNAILASFGQARTENAVQLANMLFKGDLQRSIKSQISALVDSALEIFYASKFEDWTKLDALVKRSPLELKELFERSFDLLQNAQVPATKTGSPRKNYANAKTRLTAQVLAKKWSDFLKETLVQNALNGENYDRVAIPDSFRTSIEGLADYAKEQAIADAAKQTRATWITLDAISNYFQRFKLEKGAYRFDDLTRRLVDLELADKLRQIVYRLDAQTSHILLDEFQDASFAQWAIIKTFAESIVKRSSEPSDAPISSFYCVGDVKQAIYGWRGGVAAIFDAIQRDLPNVADDSLEYNWRSCPTIINVVNLLFGKLRDNPALSSKNDDESGESNALRDAVFTWTSRFNEHKVAEKNRSKLGYWALEVAPRVDEASGKAPNPALPPINVFRGETEYVDDAPENAAWEQFNDEETEQDESEGVEEGENEEENSLEKGSYSKLTVQSTVNYAVERIVQLRKRYPSASIGVLTRTNKRIAQIISKLKKKGIEVSEEGGVPLTDSPAVDAVLSVLKLASHPGDSVAEFHIANIAPLARRFNLQPKGSKNESCGRSASYYIRQIVETRGLGRFVAELRDLLKPICETARDVERLDKLVEFAYCYQLGALKVDLDEFIQATRDKKIESPSSSSLRVMSLHKSKGLQFDIVVLPELDARLNRMDAKFYVGRETPTSPIDRVVRYLPKAERASLPEEFKKVFSDALQAQLEEALCLLYVGLTRPVRMLVAIVQPNKRNNYQFPTFGNILRGTHDACSPLPEESPCYHRAQILFEEGDPDWAKNDPTAQKLSLESRVETNANEEELRRPLISTSIIAERGDSTKFSTSPDRRLLLRRETPTGERGKRVWKRDVNFRQGTAIHACFEAIEWLDLDGAPSDETLEEILYPILLEKSEVRRALERFRASLKSPFVRTLLSRSTYERPTAENVASRATNRGLRAPGWKVFRERPFSLLKGKDILMRGTIDRLVVLYDGERAVGADVLDYKTDRFTKWEEFRGDPTKFEVSPTGSPIPKETLEEYRTQLACYGEVVGKQFALSQDQISLRLAFVDAGEGCAIDARRTV